MSHSSNVPDPYPNWDCGPNGNIVGGNQREEWSPCNAMDFRRIYTESDNWCLPGTICGVKANSILKQELGVILTSMDCDKVKNWLDQMF